MEIAHEMHRDIHTGFMVKEMIKSGYYDDGYQYFGAAYWQNNGVDFFISSDEISVCTTVERMMLEGVIVTPVLEIIRRLKLSEGEREQSLFLLQEELKQKLLEIYPLEYFFILTKLSNEPNQNTAFHLLENYRNILLNKENYNKWDTFAGLVQIAKNAKLLNGAGYNALLEGISSSTLNLDQSMQRTMTGFAYLDASGQCQYYTNGYPPKTLEKKLQLTSQKVLSTPILEFHQDMENKQVRQVRAIRKEFLSLMSDIFDKEYLNVLQQLYQLPAAINKERFSDMLKTAATALSSIAILSINGYGFLWHVL